LLLCYRRECAWKTIEELEEAETINLFVEVYFELYTADAHQWAGGI
jgi:hypothetical protein